LSIIDELTSLYNRRGFFNQAQQYMNARTQEGKGFYLIVADLDRMKQINDTYGHHIGDLALMDTANILKEVFHHSEIIARMGGDEFTVVVPDTLRDALRLEDVEQEIISDMQNKLNCFNRDAGRLYHLSISMGLYYFNPAKPLAIGDLIIKADERMYACKKEKMLGNAYNI
jgi:diguanylate cyclase (GGDEF)-like protein